MSDLNKHIQQIRIDYSKAQLNESSVEKYPIKQFEKWMHEAIKSEVPEVNAMTLATTGKDFKPTLRIVLLKEFTEKGFTFFTNYHSKKGNDMAQNPHVAVNFFWIEMQRQVRIEGVIEKISEKDSEEYFKTRPRESKLGAWVSEQSTVIKNRTVLEDKFAELNKKYPDNNVPRPPYWGGYLLKPNYIEFWQGRMSRLHDRIVYKQEGNNWIIQRLAP